MFSMKRFFVHLRSALLWAFQHDAFTLARACSYSALVSLIPVILVVVELFALSHQTEAMRAILEGSVRQMLPSTTEDMFSIYLALPPVRMRTGQLVAAAIINFAGATAVMSTLIESFRRAEQVPARHWGFWKKTLLSFLLVPLSLLPMSFASLLVVFGDVIKRWVVLHSGHDFSRYVLLSWSVARWSIALLCSVTVIALVYYAGTPRTHSWRCTLPGALLATSTWFMATLGFGWYVTRVANYTQVYGALGSAMALLLWLYIISFSVILGAEFNAQLFPKAHLLRPARGGATHSPIA